MRTVILFPPLGHQTFTHIARDGTMRAWDVTKGNQIATDGRPTLWFFLEDQGVTCEKVEALYEDLDRSYAMKTDLSIPLLFIPFFGEMLLIDGHHRLWLGAYLGLSSLPMYLLSPEEAKSIQWLELAPDHPLNWRSSASRQPQPS